MRFTETPLTGAYLVEVDPRGDARGFFGRAWCKKEFEAHGLIDEIAQANIGFSHTTGTLRGLHYQVPPYEEVKVVRCTIGAIYDVIVDLRWDSPTYRRWFGIELTAQDRRMLYVPKGCAHGYQTLADDSEVFYLTSQFYAPECARGVRYDDPAFGIVWPTVVGAISDADRTWPMHGRDHGECETSAFDSTVNANHRHGGKT